MGGILGLGVAAITLGLVEHKAIAERFGRNQRFASMGGLAAAATEGPRLELRPLFEQFNAETAP